MFTGRKSSIQDFKTGLLAELRDTAEEAKRLVRDLALTPRAISPEHIGQLIKSGLQSLDLIEQEAREEARQLRARCVAAYGEHRLRQYEDNTMRSAREPDILNTLLILMICMLGEGGLTAGLMIGNGEMDVVPAVVYGLSVSTMNIVTGAVAGFLACRYMGFRLDANVPGRYDFLIRLAARLSFFGAYLATMIGMHFGALRVRATGSHSGLFDFSDIGFFEGFNDYYALAIVVVGVIGSAIAVYEGYRGFSDPKPGLTDATKHIKARISGPVESCRDRLLDSAAMILDGTVDTALDLRDQSEEAIETYRALHDEAADAVAASNNAVRHAKDSIRAAAAKQKSVDTYLTQRPVRAAWIDLSDFDDLLLPELSALDPAICAAPEGLERIDAGLALLHARHTQCVNVIETAFAWAHSDIPDLEYYASEGDEDDTRS